MVYLSESVAVRNEPSEDRGQSGPAIFPIAGRDCLVRGLIYDFGECFHARCGGGRVSGI